MIKEFYIDPEDICLGDMREMENAATVEGVAVVIKRLTGMDDAAIDAIRPADLRAFRAAVRAAWTEAQESPNGTGAMPSSPSGTAKRGRPKSSRSS